jgi:hypothetical protein
MMEKIFGVAFNKIETKENAIEIIQAAAYLQFFAAALMLPVKILLEERILL